MTPLVPLVGDGPRLALNLILCGMIIAAALAIASRLGRGVSARLRHSVALGAFVAAIALPIGLSLALPIPSTVAPAAVAVAAAGSQIPARAINSAKSDIAIVVETSSRPAASSALALIWLAVAAALLLRELTGHLELASRRRRWTAADRHQRRAFGCPDDVRLLLSEKDGPAVVGLLDPAIVIPRAFMARVSLATARCIIRHEVAHIRRRDTLTNALVRVLRASLWLSPGLWWIERILRSEREAAADESAAALSDEGQAGYAEALVDAAALAGSRRGSEWLPASGWGHGTEARVSRLLHRPQAPSARLAFAVPVLVSGLLLAAGAPITDPARGPVPQLEIPSGAGSAYRQAAEALNGAIARTEPRNHVTDAAMVSRLSAFRRAGNPEPLAHALTASDPALRETAAWFAGELGDPALAPMLIDRLSDEDPHAAHAAAWALGRIGHPASLPALLNATRDPRPDVRQGTAWALGQMRVASAKGRLTRLRDDRDEDVRHAAIRALRRLDSK